ncbi:MAG: 50S ribosomal protein L9 [Anaerolineales bacterium]
MKVLLIQDVYNLGRAGDVKKVANGYGRNFLIPQGLAVLATPGALKQVGRIRVQADEKRTVLNEEMSIVAEKLAEIKLTYPVKASETGKLYGSVTPQMIADSINQEAGVEISRSQVDAQSIRFIGVHQVKIRLTIDQIPEVTVIVHREGEAPETAELEPGIEPGTEDKLSIADVVAEIEPEVEDGLEVASQLAAAEAVAEIEPEVEDGLEVANQLAAAEVETELELAAAEVEAELELAVASQPTEAEVVAEIEPEVEDGLEVASQLTTAESETEVEPEAVEAEIEAETEPAPPEEELEAVPDPEETEEGTAS